MTTLETVVPPALVESLDAAPPAPLPAFLRMRRREPGVADGFVDGGWWPRSLNLRAELPRLVAALSFDGYDVTRVVYNPAAWDPAPHTMRVSDRIVVLDDAPGQHARSVGLADASGATLIDLVVIPPRTEPALAERVLALAELGGDLLRVVELFDRLDREPLAAAWESDGGRVQAP